MIQIDDEGYVTMNSYTVGELYAEFGCIYMTIIDSCEKIGIPWGNTRYEIEKVMRRVEEMHIEKKHKDIIEKFKMSNDEQVGNDE